MSWSVVGDWLRHPRRRFEWDKHHALVRVRVSVSRRHSMLFRLSCFGEESKLTRPSRHTVLRQQVHEERRRDVAQLSRL